MGRIEKFLMGPRLLKARILAGYMGLRTERLVNLHRAMEYLNWMHFDGATAVGDYCEFGVAGGNSMITAHGVSKMYDRLGSMHFFGFDSFAGLPETDNTLDIHSGWKKGDYAHSLEMVRRAFRQAGISRNDYTLVPGLFEDTLNTTTAQDIGVKKISYAHIDCDYYSSTKTALNFIKPYLMEGAILDFDDFYCYPSPQQGEPRALQEWLEENPDIHVRPFSRYSTFGETFTVYFNKKKR